MDTSLRLFIQQFTGVVLATLVPVILVAFMSIPFILGGHPGELPASTRVQHMT
jgi:hypothetical protein